MHRPHGVDGIGGYVTTKDLVKLPEDEDLAQLRARLAELGEELANRALLLATLRHELTDLDMRFQVVAGDSRKSEPGAPTPPIGIRLL